MSRKIYWILSCLAICAVLARPMQAQEQAQKAAKPDSPEVLAHIEKAKKIAGTFWAMEEHYFCEAPRATQAADPGAVRIFDNLYLIPGPYSGANGVIFVIPTSAGIMLIDSGFRKDVEPVLLKGFKTLGLNPADIKLVILTHGHADHFGGATYLQERYGVRVAVSAPDWDFMANPLPPPAGNAGGAPPQIPPKRDMVLAEGQPITLGDEKVTPVFTPGHTPGSMGLIFPLKEAGKTHMVGIYGGGTFGTITNSPISEAQQFTQSLAHFEEWTKKMKVDVELQNHPVMDGFGDKLAAIRARKPGDPNPFVVGQANYTKFLEVWIECAKAGLARRSQ